MSFQIGGLYRNVGAFSLDRRGEVSAPAIVSMKRMLDEHSKQRVKDDLYNQKPPQERRAIMKDPATELYIGKGLC